MNDDLDDPEAQSDPGETGETVEPGTDDQADDTSTADMLKSDDAAGAFNSPPAPPAPPGPPVGASSVGAGVIGAGTPQHSPLSIPAQPMDQERFARKVAGGVSSYMKGA